VEHILTIDFFKNISAIIGLILSSVSLLALVSKNVRNLLSGIVRKYGSVDSTEENIKEIKHLLESHIEDEKIYKAQLSETISTMMDFAETQCRSNIKSIFYKYKDKRCLPIYEKKTLINLKTLYVHRMNKNSYGKLLLDEMEQWDVDYSSLIDGDE